MGKHDDTLAEVFVDPVKANIRWADIEAMFKSFGATIIEGRGSRVRIELNGEDAVFHRPHPQKEAPRGAVRQARQFLTTAGVRP